MGRSQILAIALCIAMQGGAQEAREWSLTDCIQHALAHNLNIKQQQDNVQQQQLQLSTSKNSRSEEPHV